MNAAVTTMGIARATVTNVAASSSSHAPRRDAIVHAAKGRNRPVSSGTACGRIPTTSSVGRHAPVRRHRRCRTAQHVGLREQRERRRRDHERDGHRARLVVHPAPDAGVALGLQRQRAAGDEARDARHRVQGEHERVAEQDVSDGLHRRRHVDPRLDVVRRVGRREMRDDHDGRQQRGADREREPEPGAQRRPRARVPALQRATRIAQALDDDELGGHRPRRSTGRAPRLNARTVCLSDRGAAGAARAPSPRARSSCSSSTCRAGGRGR